MEMCKEESNFNYTDAFWAKSGLTLQKKLMRELISSKVYEQTPQTQEYCTDPAATDPADGSMQPSLTYIFHQLLTACHQLN